ncbi:hypothetical protein ABGB07_38820 [Micromonosporaceae bacterium B7E4]
MLAALAALVSMFFVQPSLAAGTTAAGGPAGPPGNAVIAGYGCNHDACLEVAPEGGGAWVRCMHRPVPWRNITGHCHFWGPHYDFNEADRHMPPWEEGPWHWVNTQGVHCLELWELVNGGYVSRGLPCVSG